MRAVFITLHYINESIREPQPHLEAGYGKSKRDLAEDRKMNLLSACTVCVLICSSFTMARDTLIKVQFRRANSRKKLKIRSAFLLFFGCFSSVPPHQHDIFIENRQAMLKRFYGSRHHRELCLLSRNEIHELPWLISHLRRRRLMTNHAAPEAAPAPRGNALPHRRVGRQVNPAVCKVASVLLTSLYLCTSFLH